MRKKLFHRATLCAWQQAFAFSVPVKSTFTMWLNDQVRTDPKGILCFPYDISNGTKLFSHSLRPSHPVPMTHLETEPFHKVFLPVLDNKKICYICTVTTFENEEIHCLQSDFLS